MKKYCFSVLLFCLFLNTSKLSGQGNYEIQVYPSETIGKGITMVELHSNLSIPGTQMVEETGTSEHSFHETLEITHGFTSFFEVGFYQFTRIQNDFEFQWIGTHLRPRISIPESLKWPVGLSLSTEIGYQSSKYSPDTWTLEIRPVVDKDFKLVYFSFNPAFGKSLEGLNENQPFDFEPGLKIAFHINSKIDFGTEYYGAMGPLFQTFPIQNQEHVLYAALDLNLHPAWEFNLGTGWGLTDSSDSFTVKLILGRKFGKAR
jgi:hypothetical protein